jgi:hypothetical protein
VSRKTLGGLGDVLSVRSESNRIAEALGYAVNPNLPPLDSDVDLRSTDDVVDRVLCLYAATAVAFGFPAAGAAQWTEHERIAGALSSPERSLLEGTRSAHDDDRKKVEALWALLWATGRGTTMDFSTVCPQNTVHMLPNIKIQESSAPFRAGSKLRSREEVLASADLAYVVHSAMVEAELQGSVPGRIPLHVVVQRRIALEWLIGSEAWEDISLDT